tara:strand:+ start:198 stop:1145 length:948 start_codon:yes stop_codon:yes gene_type:complete
MKKICNSIIETIGKTPMVKLNRIKENFNLYGSIIAKLEFFNPLGSVKDRIGLSMIEEGEKKNLIDNETIIIEPTSGNTGIALAFICASKGYKLYLTMPESMSIERRKMLKFLGAKIFLTPGSQGMKGAIEKAIELKKKYKKSFIPQQFLNQANPLIHYKTTAREIWNDTDGDVDVLVAGVGTGGTISGIGKYLKERKKKIKVYAVEPEDSPVLSGGNAGSHLIQGIGAGFVPDILDLKVIDNILSINNNTAFEYSRLLAKLEGIPGGISSGAAIAASIEIHEDKNMRNKNTVVIIPSFAERYLSTPLFSEGSSFD